MNEDSSSLKFKVAMGEGENQTIKRISKPPNDFAELKDMIYHRLKDRLQGSPKFYIYYKDLAHGMIRVESDTDLNAAVDYCHLYSLKSLKLYSKLFKIRIFPSNIYLPNLKIPNLFVYSLSISS